MGRFLTPDAYIRSIYSISHEGLKKRGIRGLILDIDNTLVPTYTRDADIKVKSFLDDLKKNGIRIVIVSNAKRDRVEQFCRFLDVDYVYKALKPFRKGYLRAVESMGLKTSEVAIAGDQLFTDILGGNLLGMKTLLIEPIDRNEPSLIRIKRLLEKPFLKGKRYLDKY